MGIISGIDLEDKKNFSLHFLHALLNTLTEKQVQELLLQNDVINKMPRYFQPKSDCEIYLNVVKLDTI